MAWFSERINSVNLAGGGGCRFKTEVSEVIGPKSVERELCVSLQSGRRMTPVAFAEAGKMSDEEVAGSARETEMEGTGLVDVFNNGKPIRLAKMQLSSGAGAGCERTFFLAMNGDGSAFRENDRETSKLQEMQKGSCQNQAGFFEYQGKTYFENLPATWPPGDEASQYHQVVAIREGKIVDVCDFRFKNHVKVDNSKVEDGAH
jgi:hypothetical protein